MTGVRHLVQCQCILPQYRESNPPIFHMFPVFSIVNEDDTVEVKLALCDNCGATHRVTDVCKSSIVHGHDSSSAVMTVNDIKPSLPEKVVDILVSYGCHVSVWEEVQFVYQTANWGSEIILAREEIGDTTQGKKLQINGQNEFSIVPFSSKVTI